MVNVLASSPVDRVFKYDRIEPKTIKLIFVVLTLNMQNWKVEMYTCARGVDRYVYLENFCFNQIAL
jgi:hypothetical protein